MRSQSPKFAIHRKKLQKIKFCTICLAFLTASFSLALFYFPIKLDEFLFQNDSRLALRRTNPFNVLRLSQNTKRTQKIGSKADKWALLRGNGNAIWSRLKPHDNSAMTKTFHPKESRCTNSPQARLIVLTMERQASLSRLLKSAEQARYGGACIDMDIWIDKRSEDRPLHRGVIETSLSFEWPHGTKRVHMRVQPGGLTRQWIWTWDMSKNGKEFAVILEDDLELAPAWYEWLVEAQRRYGAEKDVAGFTLQRHMLRGVWKNLPRYLSIPSNTSVFKYRWLGSWGFAPKREVWREFREWFHDTVLNEEKPYVPGLIATKWYIEQERPWLGYAPNMWTQWFVAFSERRNYFTVVPHLLDGTTICANHRERGLHFKSKFRPGKDAPLHYGKADSFSWPQRLLKFDWNGTILNERS